MAKVRRHDPCFIQPVFSLALDRSTADKVTAELFRAWDLWDHREMFVLPILRPCELLRDSVENIYYRGLLVSQGTSYKVWSWMSSFIVGRTLLNF